MSSTPGRSAAIVLLVVSLLLLLPGLVLPVLSIRGVLTREGVASMAPLLIDRGLNADSMKVLESMLNPAVVGFVKATGGDLRKTLIERLTPQIGKALEQSAEVEVYEQTRSILGSVRRLYEVGSPVAASLILLFSVVVPFGKAGLVAAALNTGSAAARRRLLTFVELIGKWSMADVFVVALFIAYLAAQASQSAPGDPQGSAVVAFSAHFGPGFYWFAAYCVFALASQQLTTRLIAPAQDAAATRPTDSRG
jgi:Paraquat-inducible protein A